MLTVAMAFRRGSIFAAADANHTDTFTVHDRAGAKVIHGRAEVFYVKVGQHRVAWGACAFAPERQVHGQGDEALFGHFGGVQVRALLFDGAHRMADDNRRAFCASGKVLGYEQVACNPQAVLIVEGDLFDGHLVAGIEVVSTIGHIGSQ